MNEVIKQLYERKSVRAFTEQLIDKEIEEEILQAASMAPTAGNQQLYTILKITDPEKKKQLSESCDHQPFIATGKLLLVFCADCLKWYDAFRFAGCNPRKPGEGDFLLAVNDALIAAQNAVVAAQSYGIGSCYIGDIMENIERQREIINLPEYVFPVTLLVFGYPVEQQLRRQKPPRVDIHDLVHENGYHRMNEEELRAMLECKKNTDDYVQWIRAFCERKYNSDFSKEMTRSVKAFLEEF